MFNREIVVPGYSSEPDALSQLRASNVMPSYRRQISGVEGIFMNRSADFDLSGRSAWIFISIKNRMFNRPYVNWFIDMCEEQDLQGYICRVDDPYRFNRMAELEIDALEDLEDCEVEKIERLSSDIGRMVQKAINGKRTKRVENVMWRDLEEATPQVYKDELRQAFENGSVVRDALRNHIHSMKPVDSEASFVRFAQFFLCEVPVLMHSYYTNGPTLDIYPGQQPDFFWQIEAGFFEKELPEMTRFTRQHRSMLYLNTIDRPGSSSA